MTDMSTNVNSLCFVLDKDELKPCMKQEKLSLVVREWQHFQKVINLSTVGELNRKIQEGDIATIVQLSELIQERQIGRIADEITQGFESGVRVIFIAGPSSSGKTTFCKRLQLQLMANLLHPISISLDDYYLDRENTPLDENGSYDFESLYAIDLEKFNSDLELILAGEEVALPTYNFQSGKRVYKGNKIRLDKRSVLIMEGIHCLNPLLASAIPNKKRFRIYAAALTAIASENCNWISSADNRLIRRMIRDNQFRGYTAQDTISNWMSVRKGEDKWIFPYQEHADVVFNSAMHYELAALRPMAKSLLQVIPASEPVFDEAQRLLKALRCIETINKKMLPATSLLREFVGGSSFNY